MIVTNAYHCVDVWHVEANAREEVWDGESDEDGVFQQREVHHLPEGRGWLDAARDTSANLFVNGWNDNKNPVPNCQLQSVSKLPILQNEFAVP